MPERAVAALPAEVRLEVKTSRSGAFALSSRDLEGIADGGHLAALLTDRRLRGPRWALVPAAGLGARIYGEPEIAELSEPSALLEALDRHWSDWMLDEPLYTRVLQGGVPGLTDRVRWCRREHPPRAHAATGMLREVHLARALARLRQEVDGLAPAGHGPQAEGALHQCLLEDALLQLGYAVLPNPVGVPDIVARLGPASPSDLEAARESPMSAPTFFTPATMADRLRFWYEHERAANAWLLEMLASVPAERRAEPDFQRAVDLAAHLIQARRMWLHRLGVWPEYPGGWEAPGRAASELHALFAETESAWTDYLAGLDDAALARTLDWTGTDGVRYRWPVELILTQVSTHAYYHRGQIVQLVGALGGTTRSTDLIFWSVPQILEPTA